MDVFLKQTLGLTFQAISRGDSRRERSIKCSSVVIERFEIATELTSAAWKYRYAVPMLLSLQTFHPSGKTTSCVPATVLPYSMPDRKIEPKCRLYSYLAILPRLYVEPQVSLRHQPRGIDTPAIVQPKIVSSFTLRQSIFCSLNRSFGLGYWCNDAITMNDSQLEQEQLDPSPAGALDTSSGEGSGQFPLAEIPWDDWTMMETFDQDQFGREDTTGLNDFYFGGLDREAGDFTNVSLWLDGAYQPPVPCGYCRQHRLQCLIIQTTPANPNPVTSCSSCVALFRECSLARGEKRQPAGFETVTPVLGHLHGVTEQPGGSGGGDASTRENRVEPESHGHGQSHSHDRRRFSRKGAKLLRDWFHQHQEWPYPTPEQKAELAHETGFTGKQVSDWFTNARRRRKQTYQSSKPAQVFRAGSPLPGAGGLAPMTPMERWQHSPPEEEPASASAIRNAIAFAPANSSHSSWNTSNDENDIFQNNSADDFTSESSVGSRFSHASSDSGAAWSHHSGESLPFPLLSTRSSSRSRKKRTRRQTTQTEHRYQCTFCTNTFATKYDWSRHERSVHLSLESWICTPELAETWFANDHCKLCGLSSPPLSHIETHEFDICATRPHSERTFSRKDHLRQHLRKFHHCTTLPNVEVCRVESNNVQSRCGFCGIGLMTWTARTDHLAEHFKAGWRMAQWEGDWGFDRSILSVLRNTPGQHES